MTDKRETNWRKRLYEVVFEADTPAGRLFDIVLLFLILASIVVVMLESVDSINVRYQKWLNLAEWVITILFTIEYIGRIYLVKKPTAYIFSFFGLVDLLSTLPKYLSLFFGGANAFLAIRALRLLRVFRVLKLVRFVGESDSLLRAIKASRHKISVFLLAVMSISIILGTLMYLIEANQDSGFDSIPRSVYWAIVTLTTVGYGDIAPATSLGQFIASIIMILGYGIIAVPTGIVSAEYSRGEDADHISNTRTCSNCLKEQHQEDAQFCYNCGESLNS